MIEDFDAIVIGTGQAGPALAVRLAGAGRKTAIIERKRFGGTCVNVGCIPTKTLIASARAAHGRAPCGRLRRHHRRRGPDRHGAGQGAQGRGRRAVESSGVDKWLATRPNVTADRGPRRASRARAPSASTAGSWKRPEIFINTGGRADACRRLAGLADVPYLTNTRMMDVDFLPEHLIVVGGSYIGLEFAQMYRRFGSRVTVVEMAPRLIAREDDEISAAVQAILEAEGIGVRLNARVPRRARSATSGVGRARELRGGAARRSSARTCCSPSGALPNTDDLGLDRAGIATDARGYIDVDDELRTNVAGIWALGDVNGRGAFTHTVVQRLRNRRRQSARRRAPARHRPHPRSTRSSPIRRSRGPDDRARGPRLGRPALVGRMTMARVGRARERGETQGLHEGAGRRRDEEDPRRRPARHRGRRGDPLASST